jgi:hypothetical protein
LDELGPEKYPKTLVFLHAKLFVETVLGWISSLNPLLRRGEGVKF